VPERVAAVAGAAGSGALLVDFADARRADSYRVALVNAADNQPVAERIVAESEAAFTGLPPGITVKVTVTARNEAGEGKESAAITAVVP
jgi:hypothetical protein